MLSLALALTGCGGGAGGSTGSSGSTSSSSPSSGGSTAPPSSAGTTTPPSTGAPSGGGTGTSGAPTLTASSTTASATASPTSSSVPSLQVNLSLANPPVSDLYFGTDFLGTAVTAASIAWSSSLVNGVRTGSLEMQLYAPAFLGSGTYHDTVTVHVCSDSACTTEIAGSPVSIAVIYTVTGNAISDATYAVEPTAITLESPSNGPTVSTAVNVTAYGVPPYGAYVRYTSTNGGPIASMAFQQTTAGTEPFAYGTGVLTINLKPPSTLGPGEYGDLVTLSICYDSACTRPALGSPYQIPLSYTISASAGREFQQQIVNQNLTALTVDPTGSTLYGTTAPGSLGNGTPSQLLSVNPATGATSVLMNLPSAASQIVASQDGLYLYLLSEPWSAQALSPAVQVMRVRLSSMTIDQTVPLTNLTVEPAQIAVSPIDSNTWSAAFSPQGNVFEVEIFDAATARPGLWSVTSDVVYGNEAHWSADGTMLYILDANLNSVPVGASGLAAGTLLQSGSAAQAGFDFGGNLDLAAGMLYSAGGQVLNPADNTVVGRYGYPSGVPKAELTPDTVNNRLFAAYTTTVNNVTKGTIQSFDLSTFAPLWVARLPIGTAPLRWGSNGLAWIGPGTAAGVQALYLINGTFVAP